jgi:hypothetical protein
MIQGPDEDVTLCGWRVRTEIPLPEALPWRGAADHPVDVRVRRGEIQTPWPSGVTMADQAVLAPDGFFHYRLGRAVRYRISPDGSEIVVSAHKGCWERPVLRWPLHTQCQIPLHQARGWLTLHGGAVVVDGRAVLILGISKRGKTTLTAALAVRGYRFLAEEHCVICPSMGEGGFHRVLPVMPALRLSREAVVALGEDWESCAPSMPSDWKRYLYRPDWFHDQPVPLAGVIVLRDPSQAGAPTGPRRLTGPAGAALVMAQRRMDRLYPRLRGASMAMAGWLVAERRAWEMPVSWTLETLDQGVDQVLDIASAMG